MIIQQYLGRKLFSKTIALSLLFSVGIVSEAIVSILHTLDTPMLTLGDFFLLIVKDGLPSLPIVMNLSFLIAWVSIKRDIYLKQESLSLVLTHWTQKDTQNFLFSSLLWLTSFNLLCLFYCNVLISDVGLNLNSSPLEFISKVPHSENVILKSSPHVLCYYEKSEKNRFENISIVLTTDEDWKILESDQAFVQTHDIALENAQLSVLGQDSAIVAQKMSLPLISSLSNQINYEQLGLKDLLELKTPKAKKELFWRLGLIIQPWLIFLWGRLSKIEIIFKKDIYTNKEIFSSGAFFTLSLLVIFLLSKRLIA